MSPPEPVRNRDQLADSDDERVAFFEAVAAAADPPQIVPVCCLSLYRYVCPFTFFLVKIDEYLFFLPSVVKGLRFG